MSDGSRTATFLNQGPLTVEGDMDVLRPVQDVAQTISPTSSAGARAVPHLNQPVAGGGGAAIGIMMARPAA
ncbi:hypothetical protein [Micavibrio aeruginosavorus]|uniref:hypothetical protein n=1 Tax=Micavibrio aeruginosavorus TaxID=349221 RepID=UPI003F4ABC84